MWGSNHKYKEIIQMSKETKGSENSQSQPRLSNESVCIKQLSILKNTESYKKVLSSHFFKSL